MDWRNAQIGGHVNPGWVSIVDELHEKVLEIDPNVSVAQVKEKFGGLRYYYDTDSDRADEIEKLVDEAERLATRTCEVCGKSGETSAWGRGWLNTLCPKHGAVRQETGTPAWRQAEEKQEL